MKRRYLLSIPIIVLGMWFALLVKRAQVSTTPLPPGYSDAEFWHILTDLSEPGGFFRSDNFVSNETSFQNVIPELRRNTRPGGAYIGVGPDQNFTYIVALRPQVGFVVDIRRQNMLEHLLYKAIIEMSDNRAQFLSRLFSRPIPVDLPYAATSEQLLNAFSRSATSEDLFQKNYREVMDRLIDIHHFSLEEDDPKIVEYVYRAFFAAGPDIRYSFPNQYGWRRFPTYAELMNETDMRGENHSYVATDDNFQFLKEMERGNRIIPLVGDFAGEKTLRKLGQYLAEHGATVSAFYTSNVEYYLFQSEDWRKFYRNAASLPVDENSIFIRAYFNNQRFQPQLGGLQPQTFLDNIPAVLSAVSRGSIRSYEDVIQHSR